MNNVDLRIGQLLVNAGYMTECDVSRVLLQSSGRLFGDVALETGLISEKMLVEVVAHLHNVTIGDVSYVTPHFPSQKALAIAKRHLCVPFLSTDGLAFAMHDPGDLRTIDSMRHFYDDHPVRIVALGKSDIYSLFDELDTSFCSEDDSSVLPIIYGEYNNGSFLEMLPNLFLRCFQRCITWMTKVGVIDKERNPQASESTDVSEHLVDDITDIISLALQKGASDIHIEPSLTHVGVRFRIDGVLREVRVFSPELYAQIRNQMKMMAGLDITQRHLPQSGHISFMLDGRELDLRLSTHPGIYGENLTVRILDGTKGLLAIDHLGFDSCAVAWLKRMLHRKHGLFLLVGPTGVGKTTTVYAMLDYINSSQVKIMTLEDPIEYRMDGLVQLDVKQYLSFAEGVRSILRQDPDVLFIGEIRDNETAAACVRAALTGRLVIATVHAFSANGCVRRLMDLGVPGSELAHVLIGFFAQRLVRVASGEGRVPIVEYMEVSPVIARKIIDEDDFHDEDFCATFRESAQNGIASGVITYEDVMRVLESA